MIHPLAEVEPGARIGASTKVWRHAHVRAGARIGKSCMIGQGCYVGERARIGDRCRIQNHVSVYDGVELDDDVFIGPSAVFTNVKRPRAAYPRKSSFEATRVGRGATIGANATIVCGVRIGSYAFVGAGAVVISDVPDHGLAVGVPARVIGWMCACSETIARKARRGAAVCPTCGIGPGQGRSAKAVQRAVARADHDLAVRPQRGRRLDSVARAK